MDLKNIFQSSVLNEIQELNKKKSLTSQYEREVAMTKKKQLAPVIEFLDMFVKSQIYVKHRDHYVLHSHSIEPQLFSFFIGDSSKSWSPGVSIFIEHPEIEIAIPNNKDEGVIVIFISSHHPDSFLINQKFTNMESAIRALGNFLGRCAVKIDKPQAVLSEDSSTVSPLPVKKDANFFSNVPMNPKPKTSSQNGSNATIDRMFNNENDENN